ncbi:shikimate kinase AroK [Thiolapillus sp.]|uniref:shikimate kinase AroK n=1 Tax=Thiolapillus sp. TaxID=2017437 RepID=UPI0025DAC767|nr:shikimate kinase AroK [Thiolapillus sp.]
MLKPSRIFLVGPMGAGKTTIGRQLAQALGLEFEDTDQEIQRRTGVDIPTIFEYEGEEGFRKREMKAIEEMVEQDNVVLATGGGAVTQPENRRLLAARGYVIYLSCSPEQQYERTYKDKNRPLLQTGDPLEMLKALNAERDPEYREIADLVVSTEGRSAQAVVKEVMRHFESA